MMGLAPSDFWRLSLAEWRWLTTPTTHAAMSRDDLLSLITQYPDR